MPGGRPRIEFDIDRVEDCGKLHCTYEEMASLFECSFDTIKRRMDDESSEFCVAYKRGSAIGKKSLRRKQAEVAESGNPTMLIWLGKQLLGQRDKMDVGSDPDRPVKAEITTHISRGLPPLPGETEQE